MSTKSLRFPVILYKRAKEIMQQYVAASKIIGYDAQNTRDLKSIVFLIFSTEGFWWFHGIFFHTNRYNFLYVPI